MKPLSVKYITKIIDGNIIQGSNDLMIENCAYRLKQVKRKNTLFFSKKIGLNWEKMEQYFPLVIVIEESIEINNKKTNILGLTIIQVKDLQKALWNFIKHYRGLFNIPIIAITGTSGKTTTKEMIKHILEEDKKVAATSRSNNSRTAHLEYLLNIDDETDAAVFETAVGAPGDILNASEYFAPTIGVITNIGSHHLNFCKTEEEYINAKGEMVRAVGENGVLIINADDLNCKKINLENFKGKIVTIGIHSNAHFKASHLKYKDNGMDFILNYKGHYYPIFVPGFGEHQVFNALAAVAAVKNIGGSIPKSIARIRTFKPLNKHLQFFNGKNGSKIIDDTWSSNTTSLEAALKVLSAVGKDKKKVAILSSFTDLGSWNYIIHERAGEFIAKTDIDVLITLGPISKWMANRALDHGFNGLHYSFGNSDQVVNFLEKTINEKTLILVKGDMYAKVPKEIVSKLIEREPFN
ncbi:UDP-N-acetylmuramoyl-tripeptide--D-alanyl-D-alanine ligase [Metabacillus sp. KIGAM252]|uniref:UDP-N-acetylmuramoyl-tripeptide--D-alanyl-D-alanine ligase n=1 Tax=Metabacillus flavus TaxID=2823519 RepID=A0ABS5LI68_9BACI|nr:UDP-N-acetylmuramoyl-tripeptide--D-alanyl-D-alanine ligase [Metabacillus flavus]MBS2970268.1 UDP-N-acetylmuramoyl-tripeptide--D-alanyl-D-alanine ligase [Metabacillus flavus]